jgi:3-phosphoglycerate kinase
MLLIAALFAPFFISVGIVPPKVVASHHEANPIIVVDMSHGQYSSYVFGEEDTWMADNLTAMGFDVVFAWGGLNASILAAADGLLVGGIYGVTNGFTAQEVTDVAAWFNAGKKFLWVGSDSDYSGYAYINNNASLILDAVGSHVYPEAISISDAISNCNASYRVVANGTSTDPFVADIVDGVSQVLMHGPTSLYGSTSGAEGTDVVALEDETIEDVYPVLYYGASATIGDSDLVPPLAHDDGDSGEFVAMTVEVNAGTAGTGVLVVAGASPYGDYQPMYTTEYYDVPLEGNVLVEQTIDWGMDMVLDPIIVVDMSHGQYSSYVFGEEDTWMKGNLTAMGYRVGFAWGGLNDSILARADGLLIGGIYGVTNGFTAAEITAVADWFNEGNKFLWVGSDSDYSGYAYINNNASLILDAVGSHVYPEAISISDAISNCNASYRVVANGTSTDPFVADIVDGVSQVLMHGPTSLYGSTSGAEGTDVVALEDESIANVYPILYYGASATIGDSDLVPPLAHDDGDSGEFVAMTLEINAGTAGTGVIVVAGASPYGDYQPMYTTEYYDVPLEGNVLVEQTIDFGMNYAMNPTPPGPGFAIDPVLLMGIAGAVVVVIIIVVVMRRR